MSARGDRRGHDLDADATAGFLAHVPADRRRALARGEVLPDRVSGAALFADISGFTPLTELLANELGAQLGAEELTANLNRLFNALIDDLDRFGGHVIYFGGDAITCWLDGDDGARATACALAMKETMGAIGELVTPAGVRMRLALKAAIAVGTARRFVVGDPAIQLVDVLAGKLIDALSAAEQLAARDEVVLDESALRSLQQRVDVETLKADAETGRTFGVVTKINGVIDPMPWRSAEEPPLDVISTWILPAVRERLHAGRGEFLAELRPAVPMFIHFAGIDYDADVDAMRKLDVVVRRVQSTVTSFGGNLLQLVLGDKGGYLFAVFGAPLAHEDDAARAMAAALELRKLDQETAATGIQIGITHGKLLSGTYGHRRRQAFSCMGDAVNVAARLMASAPSGAVYVSSAAVRAAGDSFVCRTLPPLAVKGKSDPIEVFALEGKARHVVRDVTVSGQLLVGRAEELRTLVRHLDAAAAGQGRLVAVSADAGMGKSRLVAEVTAIAAQREVAVAQGECYTYGTNTGYLPWRTILSHLFGLSDHLDADARIRSVRAHLAAVHSSLLPRVPLLAGILDLQIADNELTGSMDPKLRKMSLEALLVDFLRARSIPLVIVLEDCHWLDSLSQDLLMALGRTLSDLPLLVLLAYRPTMDAAVATALHALPHFFEIRLAELHDADAEQLVRSRAQAMLMTADVPLTKLVNLITARAQGNPFYIEELLTLIHSQGVRLDDESRLKSLDLPGSLQSLLLSRIDALGEAPRQTLKVASVLGRTFSAAVLPAVYPRLGTVNEIEGHLKVLATSGLVTADQEAAGAYLFRHVVTQEAAYESMPFAFRSMLHERTASLMESDASAIERQLDLLAHHYSRSANVAKKREYLLRAGDAAQAQYANPAAIDYFERLATLVEEQERVDVLLKLGKVLELVGNWSRAEKMAREALALAEKLHDDHSCGLCETSLAEVLRKEGRFDESIALLERAAQRSRSLGNESGVARVFHLVGTVAAQRGDYDKAVESYEASLAIRERMGDKAGMGGLLSNLGVVAEYRGDYVTGRAFYERALAIRIETGDRWAIGVSMNNVGINALNQENYLQAREYFTKSMQLCHEVGDPWMVAIGHNNLGNANRGLGDYASARRSYADSLSAYRNYDDRWALAFLFEDIGILAALEGDPRSALTLIGAADASRDAIQAPRAPAVEDDIQKKIAVSVASLSEQERAACRTRGHGLGPVAAALFALEYCEPTRQKEVATTR